MPSGGWPRRYHPDTGTEPDAEERFKEIAEADGVLSDPARRRDFDAAGFVGLPGANLEDLWGGIDFADVFGAAASSGRYRGSVRKDRSQYPERTRGCSAALATDCAAAGRCVCRLSSLVRPRDGISRLLIGSP